MDDAIADENSGSTPAVPTRFQGLTAKQRAGIEKMDRDMPGLDELGITDSVPGEACMQLETAMWNLRERRKAMGLTIAQVAKESELSQEVVRDLESVHTINPNLDTLYRYAMAMGATINLVVGDLIDCNVEGNAEEQEGEEADGK